MNWQIFALILGVLALLVSLLELLGEINKDRILRTVRNGEGEPMLFPESTVARSKRLPIKYRVSASRESIHFTKDGVIHSTKTEGEIIRIYESCSTEQRTELLTYLQEKQLAEMDRTRLSGIWWFFLGLFRHAYASAEHRHPRPVEKKLAD